MSLLFDPDRIFSRLRGRASEAELIQSRAEVFPLVFKSNRLKSAETNFSCGAGLRVVADGRIGFAASNDPGGTDSLVERALESARYGDKARFSLPGGCPAAAKDPVVFHEEVVRYGYREKMDLGRSCMDRLLAADPSLSVDLTAETSVSERHLSNLKGLSLHRRRTRYDFGYSALHVGERGFLWLSEGNTACNLDFRDKAQIEKTCRLLSLARRIAPHGDPDTVILEPPVLSTLVSTFLMGINGKTVFKGASPMAGKIGKRVADGRFSLAEDPFLDHKPGSAPFDAEGVPRQRNVLIDRGVLRMFVYDLQTAGLAGAETTGNAERDFSTLPSPGYSNLVIAPGDKGTDRMIRDTKNGLWVHSVLGSGQSNMLAGDFSLNAHLAYRIEKGEITGRVKDTMISGNVYDVFNHVVEIGSEADDSSSRIFPPMSFQNINVSG